MNLTYVSSKIVAISCDIQNFNIPLFYVSESSTDIIEDVNVVTVPNNTTEFSILMGVQSETSTTRVTPLPINTKTYLNNSLVNIYPTTLVNLVFAKDNQVYGNSSYSSGHMWTIFGIVTSDNKVIFGVKSYGKNDSISNYTISYPTSTTFGYAVGFGNENNSYVASFSRPQLADTDIQNFYSGLSEPDTDPYVDGGGSSGGGGGTGDFDNTSDTIPIPSLPSISGLNTGFFTAFVCTQSQLQSVSNYLWTDVISDIIDTSTGLGEKVDALKKMVTSPYDAIMGCSLVPVSPPTGGSKDLKMYGVIDTGITLPYASSRWVEVDCGTLNIQEHWGSYLDYSPYTKTTSLYLPYIGVVSVDIDLIMAKALQVVYHVDILTGICIAYIVVDGSVKFQYQGHCSTTIPVTSSDYSGAIQSGLGLVGNIANVVSSGVSGGLSGGLGGATLGAVSSAISQAPSVASNVMGMKPDIKSGGGVGSSGGILGVQKPFLIIERPKQSVPAFQNGFSGYPCNMTMKLADLSGYTEVERINLTNIPLTEEEKNELLEILESGVYL